jgi:glycosyltransferase involved in cell wall biosynthesis
MRIVFLTHALDGGGAARSLFILIRQMCMDYPDIKIKVISLVKPSHGDKVIQEYESMGVSVSIIRAPGVPVHFSGCPKPNFRSFLSIMFRGLGLFQIRIAVQAFQPDIVLANSYVTLFACYWLRAIPIILFAREIIDISNGPITLTLLKKVIKKSITAVICIGPREYEQVQSLFGVPTYMVFNSASTLSYTQVSTITHQQALNEPINYGVFGQLFPQKGQFLLVEAVAEKAGEFRKRNIKIHIYGGKLIEPHNKKPRKADDRVYYLNLLRDRIALLGIEDLVVIHGWVDDVEKKMHSIGLVIRPDLSGSPWGRDIIEAMSLGKAILATGDEDVFIKNGVNGRLIPPNNKELLGKAMIELANVNILSAMGRNSLEFARQNFDPVINTRKVVSIITEVTKVHF